jgi:hypothetical protein
MWNDQSAMTMAGDRANGARTTKEIDMARQLVLAFYPSQEEAEGAAAMLKASGLAEGDAIGILALDDAGKLVEEKVGATSVAAGVGVGAAMLALGPYFLGYGIGAAVVGGGVGVAGGGLMGDLHHKGLKLSSEDKERIAAELGAGKAAVGVLAQFEQVPSIQDKLVDLGGVASAHEVVDEAALATVVAEE